MPADHNDLFRAWTDLTLAGVRAYSGAMLNGLDLASRAIPRASAFPAPAVHRRRPAEIWPAAGSFGGGTNAVAAWAEVAGNMMGVAPARTSAQMFNPWAWMLPRPAPSLMPPWLAGPMSPAMFAPMAMWSRAFGLPGTIPGFGWPMPGQVVPFAPFAGLADPFRMFTMMRPVFGAPAPKPPRRSSYH